MRDGRPNPDIWGNIITCVEIGQGIYCIIGRDKRGIEMPKETAEKVLNEAVQFSILTSALQSPHRISIKQLQEMP